MDSLETELSFGNTKLHLTDLIDIKVLRRIEEAFSNLTGMSAMTSDIDGMPVTNGSNYTDFCMKYTRNSPLGSRRCEWCDKFGAEQTLQTGEPVTYYCHAGLIDFSAPILAHGRQIGCFTGGQVLTQPMDLDNVRKLAEEFDIDPDEYVEAAKKVHVLPKATIDNAAAFLYDISHILSDMAYGSYATKLANAEIERASKMKSDFLANMSHEIRTPMNAVIGMAEMALREDLPPTARDYVQQIKSSGKELLTIINDILDFSKIESGKMDITPVEYETMSIVNDVVNILMTRLKDKDVELLIDLTPDIPRLLVGDNIRIKQILINIANNAAKFTNEGSITIKVGYQKKTRQEIEMQIAVQDTGIGIKEQDLAKLFQSFQQVDSKRNRNVEGTGLGLAISKQLLSLMGGDIKVESEYGKGSTFSFHFPQQIVEAEPSIELKHPEEKAVAGCIADKLLRTQIMKDCGVLNVEYFDVTTEEELLEHIAANGGREHFLLADIDSFSAEWERFADRHPEVKVVLIVDFFDTTKYDITNLLVIKKPVYTLTIATLLKGEEIQFTYDESGDTDFDFIAPEAEILVVDDNAVNLTIVEGLLKPMQIQIQKALSGKEALELIEANKFDIVFMDHMMPEMDGVETTRVIRRFHAEYDEIPIIALTANAVDGTRKMFLNEGMNDFVPKPIELRMLISKIRQWLPVEKIQKADGNTLQEAMGNTDITVGDLDTKSAIQLLGSEALFWSILETYYKSIEKRASQIQELMEQEDWATYTIEVHSLKSFSSQIGATELSSMAAEMEKAGNARNIEKICQYTAPMLERYRGYIATLEPYFQSEEDDTEKEEITYDVLNGFFETMQEAMDNLDMDQMEEVADQMNKYSYPEEQQGLLEQLKEAVEEIDTDALETIIAEWKEKIQA